MVDGIYYIGKESINLAKQEKIRKQEEAKKAQALKESEANK